MACGWGTARQRLGAVRVWICCLWLLRIAGDPIGDLAVLPAESFNPLGVLNVLPDTWWPILLRTDLLTGLRWTACAALLLAAVGIVTRPALAAATLMLLFTQGVIRGYSFINHAELPLLLITGLLCVAPCDEAWALRPADPTRHGHRGALLLARVLIVAPCSFMGVHRLIYGGVELFASDSLLHYVLYRTFGAHQYGFTGGVVLVDHPWLYAAAVVGFVLLTCCEAAAPLALVSRRYAAVLVPTMLLAHVVILLTMNIAFWELAALYALLLRPPRRSTARVAPVGRPALAH